MRTPLVRLAFGVVALATLAAFFITQQLKADPPLVTAFVIGPKAISPNGDGFQDTAEVGFNLSDPARISFVVVDSEGREVRRIVDERPLAGDTRHRYSWDGRDEEGRVVPDGIYRLRVIRRDEGRVIESLKELEVDTVPPEPVLASARPGVIAPGGGRRTRVVVRYRGPRNAGPEFRVFRTDGGRPRVVRRFRGNDRSGVWDGRVGGRPAPDGDYAFTARVRDRAGNVAEAPAPVPTRRTARAGTGVAVRRLTLSGPLRTVAAGSVATLEVGPRARRFEFALSRLGSARPVRRGVRRGGRFRVRLPRRARTGLYSVRVRAGGRRASWPLVVAGLPPTRSRRPRPLVVLPAITWQGLNPWDDDLDGFADTLDVARRVRLGRPFARSSVPRLQAEAVPLLRYLDRERLPYDLTTDLALARREGPALGNAPGLLFAGGPRWLPAPLEQRLRRRVEEGGRLAWFGAGAFRRAVGLGRAELRSPSGERPADAFGERTRILRTSRAPLAVQIDRLRLFRGFDRFLGDFTVFERSERLPRGARLQTGAGRDPGEPAFVAYSLGRGLVLRSGTPQWSRQLEERSLGVEVPRATRRIWRLLLGD